jgi:hypothetical protein
MYEELVKKYLKLQVNEAEAKTLASGGHPAISLAKSIKTQDGKINNDATKEVEKTMKEYDKASGKEDKDAIVPPKTNIEKADGTKKYHEEIEMSEDNADLTYDMLEVPEKFKDRAKKGIEGDPTMGNKVYTGKDNGNTESVWGASKDDYGKDLVKTKIDRAKDTSQPSTGAGKQLGITHDETALAKKSAEKGATTPFTTKKKDATTESVENNKENISEVKMKRLRFKNPFNGMNNAIKVIPESYRVDAKVFEITDGNETYKVRWDGSLTEGKAIVLQASNQQFVNEDVAKIKHLMGYNSESTLGTIKGKDRLLEDTKFKEISDKMKVLTEESKMTVTPKVGGEAAKPKGPKNVVGKEVKPKMDETEELEEGAEGDIDGIDEGCDEGCTEGCDEKKSNS